MAVRRPRQPRTVTLADVPDDLLPNPDNGLLRLGPEGLVGDHAAWQRDRAERRQRRADWQAEHGTHFTYPELVAERRRRKGPITPLGDSS